MPGTVLPLSGTVVVGTVVASNQQAMYTGVQVPIQDEMQPMHLKCPHCSTFAPHGNHFCGKCGKPLDATVPPPDSQPSVTGNGGYWMEYRNIDMCGQGDVEIVPNWTSRTSIEELKRKVEESGYSAITVSDGHPSFGHAALKQFQYQLTSEHCKPISTCCHHPCKIYIYTPPPRMQRPQLPVGVDFPGCIATKDIQGCWGCACVPLGCACLNKVEQGPDRLLHKGVAFLFGVIPCPFSEPRVRHPGTNGFYKEGEPGNIDTYASSERMCNGLSCSCKLR